MGKFPALHGILRAEGVVEADAVVAPRQAEWSDLLLVHSRAYLSSLAAGTLGRAAERKMGLPWSEQLVVRSRLAVQGTVNAAFMALEDGLAGNLAGGTHHAFPEHGEGFCVFNDVAVAVRVLARSRWIRRALIVDLDVHQGNGTAAIFAGDASVYTFSMHGAKNYPFHKVPSTLDVSLPDGTDDDVYLEQLAHHLPVAIADSRADIAFFLAGIDVLAGDRFGRVALTREGIRRRDRFVLEALQDAGIPIVLLLSGGYARTPEETADLHAIAFREARRCYAGR